MLLEAVFPPDVRVEKEIATLVDAGHSVDLLCYRSSMDVPRYDTVRGAAVHRIYIPYNLSKVARGLIFQLPLYTRLWEYHIKKVLDLLGSDVIHVHDLPLGFPALKAIEHYKGKKPRLVVDLHENYPDLLRTSSLATDFPQRLFFSYERWAALEGKIVRRADHVIVVSDENRERLRAEHGTNRPVAVVPNYVSLRDFEQVEPGPETHAYFQNDRTNLLYVGGLDSLRGLETVLEGLAVMRAAGFQFNLVIVGSGPSEGPLSRLAEKLGLKESIRFTGQVPQARVGAFIMCTDICLLPLKRTIQTDITDPNKLYQYAYLGKPVLAAGTTHLKKRVAEMGCGLTYEPDDASSFAKTLKQLVSNRDAMERYARQGRASVVKTFNWETPGKTLLEVYTSLCEKA